MVHTQGQVDHEFECVIGTDVTDKRKMNSHTIQYINK